MSVEKIAGALLNAKTRRRKAGAEVRKCKGRKGAVSQARMDVGRAPSLPHRSERKRWVDPMESPVVIGIS